MWQNKITTSEFLSFWSKKRELGEKIITLLDENSKMVIDCDMLEANVKILKGELLEVKNAFKASEEKYHETLESAKLEKY